MLKLIQKNDFFGFVNVLIENGSVIGVRSKDQKFVFDRLKSADELCLGYDVTIIPPKKYFLPPQETLLKYGISDGFSTSEENEVVPLIIIGIHPYDLIAIEQMDRIFKDIYPDDNYIRKREATILIGVNIMNVSPNSFAGSMGTAVAEHGYDLMITDLGDSYVIDVGSEKGKVLLDRYAKVQDTGIGTSKKIRHLEKEILSKFKKQIDFPPGELPGLLWKNYSSNIWEKNASKCLSCGSCNLVCPTCYCFDIKDKNELNLKEGVRIRTWDACLLSDFARVATGENFRKDRVARFRHRFMRKTRYLYDKFGFIACVGCGRCASACLADIADPSKIFNSLKDE